MTHARGHSLTRRVGATALILGLVAPLGIAVTDAGASSVLFAAPNPYCQAMIGAHPMPPTNNSASVYHLFAKHYLHYYMKLQGEAKDPNAKISLKLLVPILTVEARSTNMKSLRGYVNAHQVTWAREWQVFDKSVVACGAWAVNLL